MPSSTVVVRIELLHEMWTICLTHSKYDGSFSDYKDHDTDGSDDANGNDDAKYITENRDEEEVFPYLWQKEKGDGRDRQVKCLIVIQRKLMSTVVEI